MVKSYLKFILPAFLSIVLVAVISIFFPAHISDSNAVRIDATPFQIIHHPSLHFLMIIILK